MTELIVVALLTAAVVLWLAAVLRGWQASARAKRRADRAVAGEDLAAVMLESAGYRIVERQAKTSWTPLVDGEPCELELRADYLVEGDGELLIAEVKTGDEAPLLTTAATRRQLLEYSVAFAVDGVLLVCPERDAIHRIEFASPRLVAADVDDDYLSRRFTASIKATVSSPLTSAATITTGGHVHGDGHGKK